MKAKHYKKIRRLHKKAQVFYGRQARRLWKVGLLRSTSVRLSEFHRAKAHENHLKWYASFTEGWSFGADADQIRRDYNYPEFNPKTAGSDEPYEQVFTFDGYSPGLRITRPSTNGPDDGW
jgi:hypothetical protein